MSQPIIILTNWSSRQLHGIAGVWTIMTRPRNWERGIGPVPAFIPDVDVLVTPQDGWLAVDAYRRRYVDRVTSRASEHDCNSRYVGIIPEKLYYDAGGGLSVLVPDGATLCCACSIEVAAHDKCHRVWAAELLRRAGWRVMLDGAELVGVDELWRPRWL